MKQRDDRSFTARQMNQLPPVQATKTHKGENFPVASLLIAPKHRGTILAYYRFARGADDIADSPSLSPDAKIAGLDLFEATLTWRNDTVEAALPLRAALATRKLPPRHALDLLRAFRMDAVKHRYANWGELMDYCAYSAAPVGRFVLDVHGESESAWPASDALCTALQIINHLQDCGADYRALNRVYVPQDAFAAQGIGAEALGEAKASPELLRVLQSVAQRTSSLVEAGANLPSEVHDFRLCLETSVIVHLAQKLMSMLLERDPLSERVHVSKPGAFVWSCLGLAAGTGTYFRRRRIAATPFGGT
ncbi:MAG: squalene synthase HpnC [Beijerinckiaceae bacterium]|nr:squalene synthase HpnC [Beijerinckiaceae bacterium]